MEFSIAALPLMAEIFPVSHLFLARQKQITVRREHPRNKESTYLYNKTKINNAIQFYGKAIYKQRERQVKTSSLHMHTWRHPESVWNWYEPDRLYIRESCDAEYGKLNIDQTFIKIQLRDILLFAKYWNIFYIKCY